MSTIYPFFYPLGFLAYLYFFWKRLREDYAHAGIFSSGFIIFVSALVFAFIANLLFKGLWFWGGLLGFLGSLFLSIRKYKMQLTETAEASAVGMLFFLLAIFLSDLNREYSPQVLGVCLFLLFSILLFYVFEKRYRKFAWYKSGKVGFSGFSVLGIVFLARAAIATVFPSMLSFVEGFKILDAIFSGVIGFSLFLKVYNLSLKSRQ